MHVAFSVHYFGDYRFTYQLKFPLELSKECRNENDSRLRSLLESADRNSVGIQAHFHLTRGNLEMSFLNDASEFTCCWPMSNNRHEHAKQPVFAVSHHSDC